MHTPLRLLLLAAFAVLSSSAEAAATTWTCTANNWTNAACWDAGVPTSTVDAVIDGDAGVNAVVTLNTTGQVANLTVNSGDLLDLNPDLNPARLGISGATVTNDGTIQLNATTFSNAEFSINRDVLLTGSGKLSAGFFQRNIISGGLGITDATLTNAASHTIEGGGLQLGFNTINLINQGLIDANQPFTGIGIDLKGSPNSLNGTNTGTLQARSGGNLDIMASGIDNTNGTIQALDGSQVRISNSRINGGTVTTAGSGTVRARGNSVFKDVTNNGAVVQIREVAGDNAQLEGTLTNNGTWSLNNNNSISRTDLTIIGDVTLAGTGMLSLSDDPNNFIRGRGFGATRDTLTNTASHTIEGAGQLGENFTKLINQGLIDATQNTNKLIVDPSSTAAGVAGVTNSGTLRGSGAGGLELTDGRFDNQGTVEALDGSSVTYTTTAETMNNTGGTLTGGTWRAVATGNGATLTVNGGQVVQNNAEIVLSGAGSVFQARNPTDSLNVVQLETSLTDNLANGTLRVLDNRDYTTTNDFTNAGTLDLGGGTFEANSLTNAGTLNLGGGTFDANSLTNNASGEIFGHGTIPDAVLNHGLVRAVGGNLNATVDGQSGTVQIDPGASLTLTGNSDAAFLVHNGDALNLGANDFTVDSDYTNANFGVGNSFDARANVTGSGQILASGDVGQAITGDVAGGTTATATMSFGNVHVGDVVTQSYQIANTGTVAPALRGAIQTAANGGNITDARLSGTGVTAQNFGPIAPGSDSGSLDVTFNATSAGALTGQVIHIENNFDNVLDQNIAIVSGGAFRLANATIDNPGAFAFGNVRIGTAGVNQALAIKNDVPDDGFSEKLDAQANGTTGGVTAIGSFNLLAPQAVDNSSIVVGLDTASAGDKSGTATIDFQSNGDGTSGLGITNLLSQQVQVNGAVYRLANPVLNTTDVTLVARRGDAAPGAGVSVTNMSPDIFTEGLNATIGGAPVTFNTAGAINNLAAGASDAASLQVGLDTSTSGAFNGQATVNFTSTGAGTTGASDLVLGNAQVNLTGKVYETAVAQIDTPMLDFGIVHVGDVVTTQGIGITNAAPVTGLNDVLLGQVTGATGPFTATGDLGAAGLGAGTSDNTSIEVGIDTASAGGFNGNATLTFASHNPDLVDVILGNQQVALQGQVNNFAEIGLSQTGGAGSLGQTGMVFTLDFGTVSQGSGLLDAALSAFNAALGPGDLLDLSFDLSGVDDFVLASFDPVTNLLAGGSGTALGIQFNPLVTGLFTDQVILHGIGHNASGFSDAVADVFLNIRVDVRGSTAVPAPGTWAITLFGIGGLLLRRCSRKA